MIHPLVSIIIPTKNSAAYLALCLESIIAQSYPHYEIIIVDNFSKDSTVTIAQKYTGQIFKKGPERCAQVNYGVAQAKGKYVYRVDADFVLEPEVLREAVRACETGKFKGVAVFNTSSPQNGFWAKVRKHERDSYEQDELIVGLRFLEKAVFQKLGGFDEELLAAEDFDIHNRFVAAGYDYARIKAKELHLGEPRSLFEIAKKSYFYGKTIGRYLKKHPGRGLRQTNPLRKSFFQDSKRFLQHPVLTLGLIVMYFTKYLCGGVGFCVSLVSKFGRG